MGFPNIGLPPNFQDRSSACLVFIECAWRLCGILQRAFPLLVYFLCGHTLLISHVLAILCLAFKIIDHENRYRSPLTAQNLVVLNVYVTKPTDNEIRTTGEMCVICHDKYSLPTRLQCSHIFCAECITGWFEKVETCPICRASVTHHNRNRH